MVLKKNTLKQTGAVVKKEKRMKQMSIAPVEESNYSGQLMEQWLWSLIIFLTQIDKHKITKLYYHTDQ